MIADCLRRCSILMVMSCTGLLFCNGCSSQKGVVIKGEAGNVKDEKVEVSRSTAPIPSDVKKKMEQSSSGKTKTGAPPSGNK